MEVALNAGDPLPGRATGHGCALTGIFDDLLKMSCYGVAQAEPGYWLDFAMANGSPSLHVLKEEDVFHGIEMIYAAGLEPAKWTDFLAHFCGMLDGASIGIQGHDIVTNKNVGALSDQYDPDMVQKYIDYYANINPWAQAMVNSKVGVALSAEELVPRELIVKSEFYADWLRPQEDIGAGVGIVLRRDRQRFLAVTGNIRFRDEEHLQLPMQRALQIFAPHIQRAFAAQRHVAMASAEATLGAFSAVDANAALLVLDASGRMLQHNAIMEAWLRAGRMRATREGRLRFDDQDANAALRAALSPDGAAAPLTAREIGFHAGDDKVPMVLYLYPLTTPDASAFEWLSDVGWPRAVAIIRDVSVPWSGLLETAARLFHLTEAERRLAEFLCSGGSLADFAEQHGVSTNTARNQLRSVFQKTGTSRQAELALLLLRTVPGAP